MLVKAIPVRKAFLFVLHQFCAKRDGILDASGHVQYTNANDTLICHAIRHHRKHSRLFRVA